MPSPVGVAIIANSHTPYRAHLHLRIAREVPEIKLWTVYTHEESNAPWSFHVPAGINPVSFGRGESSRDQSKPRYALREWRKGGRILRWMAENDVRAAVVSGYNDPGLVRILRGCHRRKRPAFLFGDSNVRGDRPPAIGRAIKRSLVEQAVRWSTGVLPCGSLGQAYFERYGARPEQVFFFPYEPDYDLPSRITDDVAAAVRARFGLTPGRRRIVYSGRLVPVKRVDLLVDAFAATAGARPEWDLMIIGDGPERERLAGRVPVDLKRRVTWTGFLDDQETVTALYRSADVLALLSDSEPWAVVINEAAAAGLAIVATDVVGAAAELVRDGVNGAIVPPGNLAAVTRALLRVTDPVHTDDMKAASADVLADWRRRGDPVQGLRRALEYARVLPPS